MFVIFIMTKTARMDQSQKTIIHIYLDTRVRLASRGKKGEIYNDVIKRLVDQYIKYSKPN